MKKKGRAVRRFRGTIGQKAGAIHLRGNPKKEQIETSSGGKAKQAD